MTQPPEYPTYPGPEQPPTPPPAGQQPPPPGYQPPPPGYQPPPPGYQYPPRQPYGAASRRSQWGEYASWWSRVGAQLLDGLIATVIFIGPLIAGIVLAVKDLEYNSFTEEYEGTVNGSGVLIAVVAGLLYLGFDLWNRGIRVGTKGQSLGKQIVGIRVAKDADGQMLGAGMGFLRWLVAIAAGIVPFGSLLDVLWPLWDDKKQTLHDKVIGSVSLRK